MINKDQNLERRTDGFFEKDRRAICKMSQLAAMMSKQEEEKWLDVLECV